MGQTLKKCYFERADNFVTYPRRFSVPLKIVPKSCILLFKLESFSSQCQTINHERTISNWSLVSQNPPWEPVASRAPQNKTCVGEVKSDVKSVGANSDIKF